MARLTAELREQTQQSPSSTSSSGPTWRTSAMANELVRLPPDGQILIYNDGGLNL